RCAARPLQTVARHSCRPVVGYSVAIVIAPGRQTVRTSGSHRDCHPKIEPVTCLDGAQYVEAMPLVEVSPRPFTGQIIVIDWTQIDSAGVVVGSSQRVLNHP